MECTLNIFCEGEKARERVGRDRRASEREREEIEKERERKRKRYFLLID